MRTLMTWTTRMALVFAIFAGAGGVQILSAADTDVIVASGTLDDKFLAQALFHVGEFWMRVPPDTEFNRWLSQGVNHKIVIRLMKNPAGYADVKNVRILSGTLMHGTAPNPTPANTDVVGRLPNGDLPVVHILFLKDEVTGTFGPITFETSDLVTVRKFDAYDDTPVSIVVQIETR